MSSGKYAIREAKAAFQTLLVTAQDRLETLSNESMVVFVIEAKIYNAIQILKTCRTELETECVATCKTRDDYWANFNTALLHLESARRRLSDKTADLDNLDILFGNTEAKLQPLRRNVSDQEKICEKLKSKYIHTDELHDTELIVIAGLDFLIGDLESIMQMTQNLEHDIITAKEDASDDYRKVNSMEACLEGRIIEVDREECLRRILRLLQVDDSTHLVWAKNLIYKYYHEGFSHDQIRNLEQDFELDI
ncbi:hypothetical protein BYT27DRAFT_7335211 [Phlegmacium glaucopus]|nr:hypothetical protein BYT27DRAFT_7335211 [Phlegmacium glaucopus]